MLLSNTFKAFKLTFQAYIIWENLLSKTDATLLANSGPVSVDPTNSAHLYRLIQRRFIAVAYIHNNRQFENYPAYPAPSSYFGTSVPFPETAAIG
jgi:hypothetical protein